MQSSIPAGEIIEDGSEDVAGENLNPFTVMVIEKKEGYTVITATDGFEALSMIADHQPNLIFMDIMMPRLDGYQTCALIKHHKIFKQTPVIMLSSKDGLFDRARGRVVGSDYYLTKPFTREELLNAIEQFANKPAEQDAS
jgi:twitching motility two-component system response regulator PilG